MLRALYSWIRGFVAGLILAGVTVTSIGVFLEMKKNVNNETKKGEKGN